MSESAPSDEPLAQQDSGVLGMPLADQELVDELGKLVAAGLRGDSTAPSKKLSGVLGGSAPVFLEIRASGQLVTSQWAEADTQAAALEQAIAAARSAAGAGLDGVDTAIVCLSFDFQTVDMGDKPSRRLVLANIHRGVRGIELAHGEAVERTAPVTMVATNRDGQKIMDAFRNEKRLSMKDMESAAVTVRSFNAAQVHVSVGKEVSSTPLLRGKRYFPIEGVTKENVEMLEKELGDYMVNATHPDGRMTYMYYPSRGTEDLKRQNMIRQWMATLSLCRLGNFREDKKIHDVAEKNIRYNLRKFYHASGKLGLIEWNKKVKLGALSLAILSLYEHPKRKQFKRQEQRMRATVEYLWQETGEFRTFFKPADRNDVQNFYPGEAQLCWAFLWRENKSDELLDKFMKSFRYYREWHFVEKNRNPAFIPWHAQAYYNVWLETQDEELKDFVFQMSDWLLGVQQWEGLAYDDCQGRFHDPSRPFGPPHASSTGVYMEGLIDAFCMARQVGEKERQESYRRSIVRGLRSVNQLLYRDGVNLYYVQKRDLLRGGVPTTVYDNIVRIDNIQHNLMAILKILREFGPEDYRP
jgi:hypothetical protein